LGAPAELGAVDELLPQRARPGRFARSRSAFRQTGAGSTQPPLLVLLLE